MEETVYLYNTDNIGVSLMFWHRCGSTLLFMFLFNSKHKPYYGYQGATQRHLFNQWYESAKHVVGHPGTYIFCDTVLPNA